MNIQAERTGEIDKLAQQNELESRINELLYKLKSSPNDLRIYNDLGISYYNRKEFHKALDIYNKSLKIDPNYFIAYNNIGIIHFELKDYQQAIECYKTAIKLNPNYVDAYNNLANACYSTKQYHDAVDNFKKAIQLKPNFGLAYNNLGLTYQALKEYDLAIQSYKKAIEINPKHPDPYNNLGFAYNDIVEYDLAIENLRKSLELNPKNAEAYNNLGISYFGKRELESAAQNYKMAVALRPDFEEAHSNLSAVYLLQGDLITGFDMYEWRFYKKNTTRDKICLVNIDQPKWSGQDIKGKTIYVYYEQGFGDTLMFSRYLPVLKDMGANVIFKPNKNMENLFKYNNFGAQIISPDFPDNEVKFDEHSPLVSLARAFKTTLDTIPLSEGYLKADPDKANIYKEKYFNNDKFKIGIFWQGNPKGTQSRATRLKHFLKFAEIQKVQLYSLQKGFGIEQLEEVPEGINIVDLGSTFNDYSDTAAAIENLDMVISIDTSVIHLAGAMGKPVWLMLNWENEWRWLMNRNDTPWYKSIRLFRQKTRDNWEELFNRVKDELIFKLGENKSPKDLRYYYNTGSRYSNQGQHEEAIRYFSKALELSQKNTDIYNSLAISYYSLNRIQDAINVYNEAVKVSPKYAVGYNNMGIMYFTLKDYEKAIECYKKAIKLNPKYVDAYNNIGNAYNIVQKYNQAVESYKRAIALKPDYADANKNLALCYFDQEKFQLAIQSFRKTLRLKPNCIESLFRLGVLEANNGNIDKAVEYYEQGLKINPNHVNINNNLALIYANREEYLKAIEVYKKLITLKPGAIETYNDLGVCYQNLEEYEAALSIFQKALELDSNYIETYCNLGVTYSALERFTESEECYRKAIQINPEHTNAYYNMGVLYTRLNRISESIECYKKAIELDPSYKYIFNLANNYLLSGNYDEGFKLYETRVNLEKYKLLKVPEFKQPKWDGKPIPDKTLFIYPEQGLGDSIQFVRYISQLTSMAKNIIFKPQSSLAKLFRQSNIPANILDNSVSIDDIEFDVQCSIMSLPHLLNIRVDNIPLSDKYIYSDPERVNFYKEKYFNNDKFKVGIKWQGNPVGNKNRQASLKDFYKLQNIEGIKLYSLQVDNGIEQLNNKSDDLEIANLGETFNDFADTAAAIENLDLIVTIDTSVAHLSGAMGKPTYILLPFDPEWRWLLNRDDTPWYKSVKLFRQNKHNHWEEIFDRIYNEINMKIH